MTRFLVLLSIVVLAPVSLAVPLIELPADLGSINWSLAPSGVIADPSRRDAVVWLGTVESVAVRPVGDEVEVEWLCRHLQVIEPGPDMLSRNPIRYEPSDTGMFLVTLFMRNTPKPAETFREKLEKAGKYILAAGKVEGVVTYAEQSAVFLSTAKMLQADHLAEVAGK